MKTYSIPNLPHGWSKATQLMSDHLPVVAIYGIEKQAPSSKKPQRSLLLEKVKEKSRMAQKKRTQERTGRPRRRPRRGARAASGCRGRCAPEYV